MSFINNVKLDLHAALTSSATSVLVVKAVSPYNDPPISGKLTIMDSLSNPTKIETISYTGRTDNSTYWTLTGVTRGIESSTASAFAVGNNAVQTWTAGDATAAVIDTTYSVGDGGLTTNDFTDADHNKLNGIAASANNYSLPASVVNDTESGALHATDALSISGHTITLKRGDSTTETVVIPDNDTVYTHPANHAISVTTGLQAALDTKAPLASPALTGAPTAPTAAANTNTTQVATTAYVQAELTDLIGGAPGTLDTLNELAAAINDDATYASTLTTALGTKVTKTTNQALSTAADAMTISGHTITLNRGDGTTDTVVVPDNNTTYSVGDGGLSQINFTSADNTKLDGIATSANNYAHPTTAGNKHIPTAGSAGQFLKYSASGTAVWATPSYTTNTDTNTWRGISDSVSTTNAAISASQTAVKAAYDRSWPNTTYSVGDGGLTTHNFTTADHNKLNGIEASATADQSAAQLLAALKTVDGNGSGGLNAGTLDGLVLGTGVNSSANQVVRTNGSGYIDAGWINTVSGVTSSTPTRIYCSQDAYIRYMTPASLAPHILNQGSTKNSHTHSYAPTSTTTTANNAMPKAGGTHTGSFIGTSTTRNQSMIGSYSSSKTDQIWSMGSAYRNHASGSNFGNLYGLAYKHTNNGTGGSMAGGHMMVWCQNGSGKAALGTNIWTSGNVTAYSDIRVKENLEVIPNAIDKVKKLNGYTYDRTDQELATPEEAAVTYNHNPTNRHVGVIAQEVLKVLPEAVTGGPNSMAGTEDDHYSVAYGNLVALLIEGMKEQQIQIDELKALIGGA